MLEWRRAKEHRTKYVYGRCHNPANGHTIDNARLNSDTGRIEFNMRNESEQGYEDSWLMAGEGWEDYFIKE